MNLHWNCTHGCNEILLGHVLFWSVGRESVHATINDWHLLVGRLEPQHGNSILGSSQLNMENSGWQRIRKSPIFQQNVYVDSHEQAKGQFSSIEPELCVSLLRVPSLKNFSALHPKLSKCSSQWMTEFLVLGGLDVLMNALEILSVRLSAQNCHIAFMDAFVALECVQCIKAALNSQAGVFYFLSSPDLVCQLVYGKDSFLLDYLYLL